MDRGEFSTFTELTGNRRLGAAPPRRSFHIAESKGDVDTFIGKVKRGAADQRAPRTKNGVCRVFPRIPMATSGKSSTTPSVGLKQGPKSPRSRAARGLEGRAPFGRPSGQRRELTVAAVSLYMSGCTCTLDTWGSPVGAEEFSSAGRASVSKTEGRGFESPTPATRRWDQERR